MPIANRLEIDKEGNLQLQVQATTLPDGVTLVGTPSVEPQKRRAGRGEAAWALAAGVTIDQVAVVDRIDRRQLPTVVVLAAAQAVRFRWVADPDPLPDETDAPTPGDDYRVVIVASRSDGYDWVGKFEVRIRP